MLWKPLPLKATPTGEKRRFDSPPQLGQFTGSEDPIGRVTSNVALHPVHLKSYVGIGHVSRETRTSVSIAYARYSLTAGDFKSTWRQESENVAL